MQARKMPEPQNTQPKAKPVSRKWLYLAWGTAAAIMLIYYGVWRYAGNEMQNAVSQWVEDQRAAGLVVEHGGVKKAGFPFFLRVHIDDPMIEAPDEWRWQTERLSIDALPYDLNRLIFSPQGNQKIVSAQMGTWYLKAEDFRASIANDDVRGWMFSVTIKNAQAAGDEGAAAQLSSLVFDLAPSPDDVNTLTLTLAGDGLVIADPGEQNNYLIDKVQTVMSLSNVASLSGGNMQAWANAGGKLNIGGLNAVMNEASIAMAGALTLDHKSQLEGALRTEITKPVGLAPYLNAAGGLTKEEADAAAAGLALAAIAGGGKISAPIEFQNGEAFISGIKIADLEPVAAH